MMSGRMLTWMPLGTYQNQQLVVSSRTVGTTRSVPASVGRWRHCGARSAHVIAAARSRATSPAPSAAVAGAARAKQLPPASWVKRPATPSAATEGPDSVPHLDAAAVPGRTSVAEVVNPASMTRATSPHPPDVVSSGSVPPADAAATPAMAATASASVPVPPELLSPQTDAPMPAGTATATPAAQTAATAAADLTLGAATMSAPRPVSPEVEPRPAEGAAGASAVPAAAAGAVAAGGGPTVTVAQQLPVQGEAPEVPSAALAAALATAGGATAVAAAAGMTKAALWGAAPSSTAAKAGAAATAGAAAKAGAAAAAAGHAAVKGSAAVKTGAAAAAAGVAAAGVGKEVQGGGGMLDQLSAWTFEDLQGEAIHLHDSLDHLGSDVTHSALDAASSLATAAQALQELLLALPEQLASGDLQQKAATTSTMLRAVMDGMQEQWVDVPWHTKLAAYAACTLGLLLLVRRQQQQEGPDKQEKSGWSLSGAAAAAAAAAEAKAGGSGSSGGWPSPSGKAALAVARGDEMWLEAELAPKDRAAAAAGGWGGAGGGSGGYKRGETFLRAMPANSWGHGGSANTSSTSGTAGDTARKNASLSAAGAGGAGVSTGGAPGGATASAGTGKKQQRGKYDVNMRALDNTSMPHSNSSSKKATGATSAAATAAAAAAGAAPQGGSASSATATKQEAERAQLKDRLHWACLAMGPLASVVPGGEPVREQVDKIITSLEALNPCFNPLSTVSKPMSLALAGGPTASNQGVGAGGGAAPGVPAMLVGTGGGAVTLSGNWRLMYASNSTTMATSRNLLAMLLQLGDALPGFGLRKITQTVTRPVPSASSSGNTSSSGSGTGAWPSSADTSQLPYAYAGTGAAAAGGGMSPSMSNSAGGGGSPGVLRRLATDKLQQATAHATAAAHQAMAVAGDITSTLLPPGGAPEAPIIPPSAAARVVNKAEFGLGLLGVWGLELCGWWVQEGADNWSSKIHLEELVLRPQQVLGVPLDAVPPLHIRIPPLGLQGDPLLVTTYLDKDTRVARGSHGELYLFKRDA